MARRRQREQTIFFPWERGGGLFRRSGISRARPFAAAIAAIAFLLLVGARERRHAGIRSTRATLGVVAQAVDAYRADHEWRCPPALEVLNKDGYLGPPPTDAWGHPFRLTCPSRRSWLGPQTPDQAAGQGPQTPQATARRDPGGYDLMSDGPDGEMGGLDRVE